MEVVYDKNIIAISNATQDSLSLGLHTWTIR